MTWQNPPGSQLPWQPGPQFPSQPGAFPGGYTGQALPGQAAPSIPPKVLQAAEAAGLGTPTQAYTKGAGKRLVGAGTLIILIVSVVILSAGILVPLLLLPTDPQEIIIILGNLTIGVFFLSFLRTGKTCLCLENARRPSRPCAMLRENRSYDAPRAKGSWFIRFSLDLKAWSSVPLG
jgi:hypothetical protein